LNLHDVVKFSPVRIVVQWVALLAGPVMLGVGVPEDRQSARDKIPAKES
jgi:hypothetical protein